MCILSTLILHVYVHTINDKPKWEKTITVYADCLQTINIPYEYMWLSLQKSSMFECKFWPIFRHLKPHNSVTAQWNVTKVCTLINAWLNLIATFWCKVIDNTYIFRHFTVIRVKLCKICEHGGFSQKQSHIISAILNTNMHNKLFSFVSKAKS